MECVGVGLQDRDQTAAGHVDAELKATPSGRGEDHDQLQDHAYGRPAIPGFVFMRYCR